MSTVERFTLYFFTSHQTSATGAKMPTRAPTAIRISELAGIIKAKYTFKDTKKSCIFASNIKRTTK